MGKHNEFGKHGEEMAADYLRQKGYNVLHRNYRYLKSEIDIIAQIGNIVAIIEVKSRNSGFLEDLADTVNPKKIKLLVSAANEYIIKNDMDVEVRFDIITILKKGKDFELEHLESAFYHF